jgi:hypothetical protein
MGTLYDNDIVAWSEQQAAVLERIAREVRANDADWNNIIEEIRDLGLSQLKTVIAYLTLASTHMLKLALWPHHPSQQHWRQEVLNFLQQASARYQPSMRQRIAPEPIGRRALHDVAQMEFPEHPPVALPARFVPDIDAMLSQEFDLTTAIATIRREFAARDG